MIFKTISPVWIYDGPSAWHFATINKEVTKKINGIKIQKRGFGSIRVKATVGKTSWTTSIFPDKEGVYLLPIKKSIRIAENIKSETKIKLTLDIIDDLLEE